MHVKNLKYLPLLVKNQKGRLLFGILGLLIFSGLFQYLNAQFTPQDIFDGWLWFGLAIVGQVIILGLSPFVLSDMLSANPGIKFYARLIGVDPVKALLVKKNESTKTCPRTLKFLNAGFHKYGHIWVEACQEFKRAANNGDVLAYMDSKKGLNREVGNAEGAIPVEGAMAALFTRKEAEAQTPNITLVQQNQISPRLATILVFVTLIALVTITLANGAQLMDRFTGSAIIPIVALLALLGIIVVGALMPKSKKENTKKDPNRRLKTLLGIEFAAVLILIVGLILAWTSYNAKGSVYTWINGYDINALAQNESAAMMAAQRQENTPTPTSTTTATSTPTAKPQPIIVQESLGYSLATKLQITEKGWSEVKTITGAINESAASLEKVKTKFEQSGGNVVKWSEVINGTNKNGLKQAYEQVDGWNSNGFFDESGAFYPGSYAARLKIMTDSGALDTAQALKMAEVGDLITKAYSDMYNMIVSLDNVYQIANQGGLKSENIDKGAANAGFDEANGFLQAYNSKVDTINDKITKAAPTLPKLNKLSGNFVDVMRGKLIPPDQIQKITATPAPTKEDSLKSFPTAAPTIAPTLTPTATAMPGPACRPAYLAEYDFWRGNKTNPLKNLYEAMPQFNINPVAKITEQSGSCGGWIVMWSLDGATSFPRGSWDIVKEISNVSPGDYVKMVPDTEYPIPGQHMFVKTDASGQQTGAVVWQIARPTPVPTPTRLPLPTNVPQPTQAPTQAPKAECTAAGRNDPNFRDLMGWQDLYGRASVNNPAKWHACGYGMLYYVQWTEDGTQLWGSLMAVPGNVAENQPFYVIAPDGCDPNDVLDCGKAVAK